MGQPIDPDGHLAFSEAHGHPPSVEVSDPRGPDELEASDRKMDSSSCCTLRDSQTHQHSSVGATTAA